MSRHKLDEAYASVKMQLGAHAHAREAALRPGATAELLTALGLPDLVGEVVKKRRRAISEHFERTGRQIRRQGFVDLVSSFEADLFKLLGTATSKARHTVNQYYGSGYPFEEHKSELIRTVGDFGTLGGYRRLLSITHRSDPRQDLWNVIAHRDCLAHGERWAPLSNPPTIDDAHATLSQELRRIEPTPTR